MRIGFGRVGECVTLTLSESCIPRRVLGIACVAVLATAACSDSSGVAPPIPQADQLAVHQVESSATSTAEAAASGPLTGFVIAWADNGTVHVGTIDPETGEYAVGPTFEVGDFAVAPNAPTTNDQSYFRRLVSPDFEFAYAQRIVDGDPHVGWGRHSRKFCGCHCERCRSAHRPERSARCERARL